MSDMLGHGVVEEGKSLLLQQLDALSFASPPAMSKSRLSGDITEGKRKRGKVTPKLPQTKLQQAATESPQIAHAAEPQVEVWRGDPQKGNAATVVNQGSQSNDGAGAL